MDKFILLEYNNRKFIVNIGNRTYYEGYFYILEKYDIPINAKISWKRLIFTNGLVEI